MDKRTKILLIVLAALILTGGGILGYMYMTAEKPAPVPMPVAARPRVKKPAVVPPAGVVPVKPAAPGEATAPTVVAKATAPAAAAKPASPGKAPAPAAPAYVPVIKVIEKGRQVQYNTPEDFLMKTTLSPEDIRAFTKKGLDEARKTYDTLLKTSGAKDALDRADKDVKMKEKLSALATAKYPAESEKTYAYSSLGKRDPFMSPFEVPKSLPKVTPNMTPLEKNPTESLVLKAVLWTNKGYRAMIETPDGRAYTVKTGEAVGNKGGRITKITERGVHVTEKITDILGDVEVRNIVLKLHKEAE